MSLGHDLGPALAVMGTFDVESYGDVLYPRIFDREIRRRCPTATVRVFSPMGWNHRAPWGGGEPAEPLGPPTSARWSQIARDHDLVAIGGGALLHEDASRYAALYPGSSEDVLATRPWEWFLPTGDGAAPASPIVWNALGLPGTPVPGATDRIARTVRSVAYVAVRDEATAREVRRCAPEADVQVVPDTLLVVDRLFTPSVLARRVRYLRALARYPAASPVLVHIASPGDETHGIGVADALVPFLATRAERPLAVLDLPAPGAAQTVASHLSRRLERSVSVVRVCSVEDVAAAVGCAALYVGSSLDTVLTAIAYEVPALLIAGAADPELDGFATLPPLAEAVVRPGTMAGSDLDRVLSPAFRRRLAGARERLRSSADATSIASSTWRWRRGSAARAAWRWGVSPASLHACLAKPPRYVEPTRPCTSAFSKSASGSPSSSARRAKARP